MVSSPPNRLVTRLRPSCGSHLFFSLCDQNLEKLAPQKQSPTSLFYSAPPFFPLLPLLPLLLLPSSTSTQHQKMKNLYAKSKGKIYPSPSSPSSPSPPPNKGGLSVLGLLPTAILAMVMVMGSEDKEALAYMLLRSMKTPSLVLQEKRRCKKVSPAAAHRPLLDCPCFDCYTSFWIRWDSSPNRELIHQAIEAFEEHLAKGESSLSTSSSKKGRKKDRRALEKATKTGSASPVGKGAAFGGDDATTAPELVGNMSAGKLAVEEDEKEVGEENVMMLSSDKAAAAEEDGTAAATATATAAAGHGRGLARKVWPDMIGMFNSRLWGLWNPTV